MPEPNAFGNAPDAVTDSYVRDTISLSLCIVSGPNGVFEPDGNYW